MCNLKRGQFALIPTWGELASKNAVYRDQHGEHVRLYAGGKIYNDDGVVGHQGVVLESLPGFRKKIRLDNGRTVTVGAEALVQLLWNQELGWVRA